MKTQMLAHEIQADIQRLKMKKNAVILAHNYQPQEIQDIADFVGDSYDLSKKAASSEAEVIVFCGVYFMAETANILAPEKTVLLPEKTAGCPLANTIDAEDVCEIRQKYPHAAVVCYVNSSAAVKAECDACCTSSNAIKVVNSLPNEQIIFIPDKNLASYVDKHTAKEIIPWKGSCNTHHRVTIDDIWKVRELHQDTPILVHPECRPEIVEKADFVGGTTAIMNFVKNSSHKKYVIGTEMGMLYPLQKLNPDKEFLILSQKLVCPNMKKTTLESIYNSLQTLEPQIKVPHDIAAKALKAVNKMLQIS